MTEVIFLGTNGWYDTSTGNTVCILAKFGRYNVMFDAGNGFYKTEEYIDKDNEVDLFLSHFHLDHLSGLHTLNKIKSLDKLNIFGPTGTRGVLKTIVNAPFTIPADQLPFRVNIHELPEDNSTLPFSAYYMPLLHSSLTYGYRIELDGKTITYCPDTGYCENAVVLARNADLLIAECAYKSGMENPEWPHLNPETAARIAKEAGAKSWRLCTLMQAYIKQWEKEKRLKDWRSGYSRILLLLKMI